MSETEGSIEARILQAVRRTLANVIKDTATPQGMRHPLSDATIQDLRQCLALISARERELAGTAAPSPALRPQFSDEPTGGNSVIRFDRNPRSDGKG